MTEIDFEWIRKNVLPKHKYLTKFIEQERFVQGFLEGYNHAQKESYASLKWYSSPDITKILEEE